MEKIWTKAFEQGREDFFSQRLDQKRIESDAEYRAGAVVALLTKLGEV